MLRLAKGWGFRIESPGDPRKASGRSSELGVVLLAVVLCHFSLSLPLVCILHPELSTGEALVHRAALGWSSGRVHTLDRSLYRGGPWGCCPKEELCGVGDQVLFSSLQSASHK